ncbi:TetM/TetW/TetO/TetS family tetracycline resistance ribosomal protection protein [Anaerovorax odorimutans]|uniref:TetM/TetW/TetO/TetS family tetracycline resistance ribosomal protection protein n=1 Tax=Anaerovorax odorimutans TaxID=109327 RepID=A0ABT1RP23_9FIRM|nr:TetM/TetW/TetO/TetS family tetracycline resistance ribosomal protection protein [Anaerovorax odorimutans]MCQ4636943.1 TetM/TetW/TetO/TetS family tetracycline resistance ribosomal protection protein [Anaerovorax odorimutans]
MENTSENKKNKSAETTTKHICLGILAHVDAGKTTLSEALLYSSGSLRKIGRVDHGDAFLDTDSLERKRGITIFSKQARFVLGKKEVTLLDTPGHVDFSSEMERTLQVMDYAILVINGADGVQSHTLTLWKLLGHYGIPVFLFVNKMDQPATDKNKRMDELKKRLDDRCVDFGAEKENEALFCEELAMCSEELMEEYLQTEAISAGHIAEAVRSRKVFPCYFGSALKMEGIEEFLAGMDRFSVCREYGSAFGARVYKISRDSQGRRLTHMKITGGSLRVKDLLTGGNGEWEDKVDQIRLYSGSQFKTADQAGPGTICAVTGLEKTFAGEGLGKESKILTPVLEPVLNYQVLLPEDCDAHSMLTKLRQLEEEEPQLRIVWNERLGEIHALLMGEVAAEILKSRISERFGIEVEFGSGSIVYKETIEEPVEGVGHFEPLRHYAEVHLLLQPGERGSGLVLSADCSEDLLDRNWQRLILTHLEEKTHIGVLTGSEVTDMKITLIAGKGHLKHTEGGDFRQATYRALRQGLKKAKSILLEPLYDFRLEVPQEMVGRAMADIQRMDGSFLPPQTEGDTAVLTGTAPAASMAQYQNEVVMYTKGRGSLSCAFKGYGPCHNQQEVIEARGYDSEKDTENPTGSVFCTHGAGFNVSWDQVEEHMHVDSGWRPQKKEPQVSPEPHFSSHRSSGHGDDKELEEIFTRTYGESKRQNARFQRPLDPAEKMPDFLKRQQEYNQEEPREKYLLVDGYNMIFAWDELKELAKVNLDSAREQLIEILSNYQGYKGDTLIVVFDAYKVEGGKGSVEKHGDLYVIYTKEAETADQYIERAVNKIGRTHDVTVATSDNMVQMIIWGEGAMRISARGLKEDIEAVNQAIRSNYLDRSGERHRPLEKLEDKIKKKNEV